VVRHCGFGADGVAGLARGVVRPPSRSRRPLSAAPAWFCPLTLSLVRSNQGECRTLRLCELVSLKRLLAGSSWSRFVSECQRS
jgi:hypothetical protein